MLRKVGGRKLVKYESHLDILVLNDMWVEWVGGMWGLFTIYGNYESGLLFADGGSTFFLWSMFLFGRVYFTFWWGI